MLPRDEQQVVEGQVEGLAQCKDDRFLGYAQGRMQGVGAVRTVLHIVPLEPLGSGGARDAEDLRRLTIRQARILDFLPDFGGWYGLVGECANSCCQLLLVRLNAGTAEPSNQVAHHSLCTEQRPATARI